MEYKGIFITLLLYTLITSNGVVSGQCRLIKHMDPDTSYLILNEGYPNYQNRSPCRWIMRTPVEAQIQFDCTNVDIPRAPGNCNPDNRLSVKYMTTAGKFSIPENYCGKIPISKVYTTKELVFDFFVSKFNVGRFRCKLFAKYNEEKPYTSPPLGGEEKPYTSSPLCDCGWTQNKRIGSGMETGVNQYPFMAALVLMYPNIELAYNHVCDSVIISNRYALTAGHCRWNSTATYGLLVGEHRLSKDGKNTATKLYRIMSFERSLYYKPNTSINMEYMNEIALIKTSLAIKFNIAVAPVCLPFNRQGHSFIGEPAKSLGWDPNSRVGGAMSDVLKEINVTIVANSNCSQNLNITTDILLDKICAYVDSNCACGGDSGGPLIWYNKEIQRYVLIGIDIGGGSICGHNEPSVFTRATTYLLWIRTTLKGTVYCTKH